ncbi:MAG: hypothetical protein JSV31_19165 [Desulfobacterales bacterium]|nr:MAG: hypothetical protein JSV31_19165 [Desulfobacterales bacterium]
MFGLNINAFIISLLVALVVTVYVAIAKNPFEKGTNEYQALRLCRIGLAFLFWSVGFGMIGLVFALVAFIFGIIGIVKGRTLYGTILIIGSVVSEVIRFFNIFGFLTSV